MKNTRIIKEIEDNNIITKLETVPVGASIARPFSKKYTIVGVGAILIARKSQRNSLKYKQAGITLIALVITIIVLLILASITINLTLGERGIFNTAKKAVENYKDAEERELVNLNNFEQEAYNTINGLGNENNAKPELPPQPVLLNTLTATNYGDYVNYPVSIGHGPEEIAETHKSDWRIFYNDGTYVYLIASYLLANNQMPSGTTMTGYSGRPYTTYWKSTVPSYTNISEVAKRYKMNWNKNTSNNNIRCISELLNSTLWKKFVYNIANGNDKDLAEEAIGGPTLEIWMENWNTKEDTKLYYNNNNNNGYYVGTTNNPTTKNISGLSENNNLYFPVNSKTKSDVNGYYYCMTCPSLANTNSLLGIGHSGSIVEASYNDYGISIRPMVRLKSSVMGLKDDNGVWQLQ